MQFLRGRRAFGQYLGEERAIASERLMLAAIGRVASPVQRVKNGLSRLSV